MANVTLFVPIEIKKKMECFPEINWSAVARQAFTQKIRDMEFLREFKSRSELTGEDALKLGRDVSKAAAKKYRGTA